MEFKENNSAVNSEKIVALWAFTEAFLGGLLHAAKIPFTGLIIGSFALLYISLLSYFNHRKGQIIQAAIIVILVKMLISHHTPVMAYFAVFYQGVLGELFFISKRFKPINCFILGLVFSILSSIQKILTLTLIFGMTFWESIDSFLNYAMNEVSIIKLNGVKYSYYIVGLYFLVHLIIGIASGIFSIKFIKNLSSNLSNPEYKIIIENEDILKEYNLFDKKKKKRFKVAKIIIYLFLIFLLLISYFAPEKINISPDSILIMIIRGFIIILIWFKFLSPFIIKIVKKIFNKKNSKYSRSIENVVSMLPLIKLIALKSWKLSSKMNGIKKFIYFIKLSIINLLLFKQT